jgi:hypothetical protein
VFGGRRVGGERSSLVDRGTVGEAVARTIDAQKRSVPGRMPDDDPLERLSSKELHDLAVRRARRHLDVGFFWRLMKVLPAAEAATGDLDESQADMQSLRAHIDDVTESGRGQVAEVLRPFYIDYLKQHGVDDVK